MMNYFGVGEKSLAGECVVTPEEKFAFTLTQTAH